MKRLIVLLIVLAAFSSAQPSLVTNTSELKEGETVFGKITLNGTFKKDITKDNFEFRRGRKIVFFEHDVSFFNGSYYFYFYAEKTGNFTLKIKDILYSDNKGFFSKTLIKNFTVEKSNTSLSIRPGFLIRGTDKFLKLINKGKKTLNLSIDKSKYTLKKNEILMYPVKQNLSSVVIYSYKTFRVPLIGEKIGIIIPPANQLLRAENIVFTYNLTKDFTNKTIIKFFSFSNKTITNISFKINLSFISFEGFSNLSPRGTANLTLIFSPDKAGFFEDKLNVSYFIENKSYTLPLTLRLFVSPSKNGTANLSEKTCKEKGGAVCLEYEVCSGEEIFTKGGVLCCVGSCKKNENKANNKGSGSSVLVGILIIGVLGLIAFLIYRKYKKVKKVPEDKLKEATDKYLKRLGGRLER